MNNKNIKFAFAINNKNNFQKGHFGDAVKYFIFEYEASTKKLINKGLINNTYKEENHNHNNKQKGIDITKLLQKHQINCLVSSRFGQNINIINKYFIPIIVDKESIDEVLEVLEQNIEWILEEYKINRDGYKLFRISKGILKQNIK